MQGQKGLAPSKILNMGNPLAEREANYQAQTLPKAFVIKDNKMPDITLQTNVGERMQDRIGSIPSVSKASFRAEMTEKDETVNLHERFVQ